jgi:GT2 family glycosyltransferase
MQIENKIGLGLVAFGRPDYLDQCLESIKTYNYGGATTFLVHIDFKDEDTSNSLEAICVKHEVPYYKSPINVTVGPSKNFLFKYLLDKGCDHIFVMEEDILLIHPNVCHHYITEAKRVGVEHMNFALHGGRNTGQKKLHKLREGVYVTVYPNCVGAWSYYTRHCLETVGLMDENFKNAWEHVEHTYRIIEKGMSTPFWYFIDHPVSHMLLKEIPGSGPGSSIGKLADHQDNIKAGQAYWIHKHGMWLAPKPSDVKIDKK